MTLDLARLTALARELREHDEKMTKGPWALGGAPYWEITAADKLPIRARWFHHDAKGICVIRNHARELANLLDAAKGEIERMRQVLGRVRDAQLADKSWRDVQAALRMNPDEDVDFETYAASMYTQWIYSNLADAALKDTPLRDDVEKVVARYDAAKNREANPAPAGERGLT
jgi:hypothetical protein